MDSSDWSDAIRYHTLSTRTDTELKTLGFEIGDILVDLLSLDLQYKTGIVVDS
jgi:hypothetical protein